MHHLSRRAALIGTRIGRSVAGTCRFAGADTEDHFSLRSRRLRGRCGKDACRSHAEEPWQAGDRRELTRRRRARWRTRR